MEFVKPSEAARQIGISYPTIKQWIYARKIKFIKTPRGHYRISQSEIRRLTGGSVSRQKAPRGLDAISGRNKLLGTIKDVQIEGLLAQVTLDVGGQTITSIITRKSCEELGLRIGVNAYALVKATEVMMVRA
jgi:molybdopterin-binding protein